MTSTFTVTASRGRHAAKRDAKKGNGDGGERRERRGGGRRGGRGGDADRVAETRGRILRAGSLVVGRRPGRGGRAGLRPAAGRAAGGDHPRHEDVPVSRPAPVPEPGRLHVEPDGRARGP